MKAQVTGQIFIYIMVIVVVGLIVLIGYTYIGKILEAKCNADRVKFVKQIEEYAEKYDGYNEVGTERISAPCDTDIVCFVDSQAVADGIDLDIADPVIKNSAEVGVETNIFLVGEETEGVGYSRKIKVADPYYICIAKTGNFLNVRFSGDSEYSTITTY